MMDIGLVDPIPPFKYLWYGLENLVLGIFILVVQDVVFERFDTKVCNFKLLPADLRERIT